MLFWSEPNTPADLQPVLRNLAREYPIEYGDAADSVKFVKSDVPGYRIEQTDGRCEVQYAEIHHAARAIGTLLAGLDHVREESLCFKRFGIMLDCSRNAVMLVEHLKKWLRRLALMGYNRVLLYTEDTYEIPGEEAFGYMRGRYTTSELQELDGFASELGIEMVGCIQTLGHLEQILKYQTYNAVKDTPGVLLAGEEKTYLLIEKMIAQMSRVFKSRSLHIGMDEAHDMGLGRYMDQHGYRDRFDLFNEHLERVVAICQQHGLQPMIWSDMYFRLASSTGDYYDEKIEIPEYAISKIPDGVELVYWDYYHEEESFYANWLDKHMQMGSEPVMASGVWTWNRLWYDHSQTVRTVQPCLKACKEKKIAEIFFTMWGDDGAFCDFDSALNGLAYVAEYAYTDTEIDEKNLSQRMRALCLSDYSAKLAASVLQSDVHGPAILWDDPLLGIYWNSVEAEGKQTWPEILQHYAKLAETLAAFIEDRQAGDGRYAWLLARLIREKISLRMELLERYGKKEKSWDDLDQRIEKITASISDVEESFRQMWLSRNKPYSLEVIQIRLAGLKTRYRELHRRFQEWQQGEIAGIAELDDARNLPGLGSGDFYKNYATSSTIL